ARLCHVMAAYAANERTELGRILQFLTNHRGNDVVAEDMPGGLPRFVAVEGTLGGGNLSPTGMTAVARLHQDDVTFLCRAEACFKWMQKLHQQLAYFNLLDKHAKLPA